MTSNNDYRYQQEDGLTHINIGYTAATELGRLLEFPANTPFTHPVYGMFYSMESFWAWVRSPDRDESLRRLNGIGLREGRQQRKTVYIMNMDDVMVAALYEKITQNPELLLLFVENTLPYDMYYIFKPKEDLDGTPLLLRNKMSGFFLRIVNRVDTLIKSGSHPLRSWYTAIPSDSKESKV